MRRLRLARTEMHQMLLFRFQTLKERGQIGRVGQDSVAQKAVLCLGPQVDEELVTLNKFVDIL